MVMRKSHHLQPHSRIWIRISFAQKNTTSEYKSTSNDDSLLSAPYLRQLMRKISYTSVI
jgi:hypothetical protein